MDNTTYARYLSCIISGAIPPLLFHPIDSFRARTFFKQKGMSWSALYNGIRFNVVTNIIKQCSIHPTQDLIKHKLNDTSLSQTQQYAVSGFASGLVHSIVTTPINTIKVPLFLESKSTVRSTISTIYNQYGVPGFARGWWATVCRDVMWNALYFPVYYYLNTKLDNRPCASVLAGMCAVCVSYPFDGVRMFRQNNKTNYNFWYGFRYAFNRSPENMKSFLVCLIRVPLSVAMSHYLYMVSTDMLNKN